MRAILHIGLPKTGTSTLQEILAGNTRALRSSGILYPKAGRTFAGRTLLRHVGLRYAMQEKGTQPTVVMQRFTLKTPERLSAYIDSFPEEFDSELSEASPETVVLSDEALFDFAEPDMIARMRDFLLPRFSSVEIVGYLRDPVGAMSSAYSQSIKVGGIMDPETFLDEKLETGLYLPRLRMWADAFGAGNMRLDILKGDVLDQFLPHLGPGVRLARTTGDVNRSLSPLGLRVLREVNLRLGTERPRYIRIAFEKNMTGASWRLPERLARRVLDMYGEELPGLIETFRFSPEAASRMAKDWTRMPAMPAGSEATAEDERTAEALAALIVDLDERRKPRDRSG